LGYPGGVLCQVSAETGELEEATQNFRMIINLEDGGGESGLLYEVQAEAFHHPLDTLEDENQYNVASSLYNPAIKEEPCLSHLYAGNGIG
jgi:hypothetical protein